MSRLYNMDLTVTEFDPSKAEKIMDAANKEWDFGDDITFNEDTNIIAGSSDGSLGGGETEEKFANRLAKAIFKANKAPCKVSVQATYMENLPYETYVFDKLNLPKVPKRR